ncbi:hypothetical protein C8J57DRAFT_1240332 [Mycena rebaudengoi]|nr:hypothetical protein C8J57DRAFT_1240332 [Mycena rebaudengoi]
MIREMREEQEQYPDPNERERARTEERLRLMQEAADRFAAIHEAKKAEYEESRAQEERVEREQVEKVPAAAWEDESERTSNLELGYLPSVGSSDEARFAHAMETAGTKHEHDELFSDDDDSMPELVSMEEEEREVESYKQCAEWRPPSFAPTNPTSHEMYGSERISPVSDLSSLYQFAEIAAGRTLLSEHAPLSELAKAATASSSPAIPTTPYPTPAESAFHQLTQSALRTSHWQEAHAFNLELSRRLPAVDESPERQPNKNEMVFALRPASPEARNVGATGKENPKREKDKGRLVLMDYSRVDQLITPMPGEGNKDKPIHRDFWSSSPDDVYSNKSSTSDTEIEPYSPIDLTDVINFGSPRPADNVEESLDSDTELIDTAEFMRLVEQITGRASRAPLPIDDPVNDNPSGFYPKNIYAPVLGRTIGRLQPFRKAQGILHNRLSRRLDNRAMTPPSLFTHKPLACVSSSPPSPFQHATSLDFSLPMEDHQVPSSTCTRLDKTVDPRCVEGKCTHKAKTLDTSASRPTPIRIKPRHPKHFRIINDLRELILDHGSRHALAELIGQLLQVRFYDGYAISQLLKAGHLDPSYDPPEDEWDTDMWEIEHEDGDTDDGMAVDEFDPRFHEDAARAYSVHTSGNRADCEDTLMESDNGKSSPHYSHPDNYDHSFSYHALGTTPSAPIVL